MMMMMMMMMMVMVMMMMMMMMMPHIVCRSQSLARPMGDGNVHVPKVAHPGW